MALITNLPTDLLRTFIAVVELGGHSKAGAVLGRSQPAISLQIRRLEELVRAPLLMHEGRAILPTPDGEALRVAGPQPFLEAAAAAMGIDRLRVVDTLNAYEIRDASGAVVSRAAARGERAFQVELTRAPDGWRLVEVRPEA